MCRYRHMKKWMSEISAMSTGIITISKFSSVYNETIAYSRYGQRLIQEVKQYYSNN